MPKPNKDSKDKEKEKEKVKPEKVKPEGVKAQGEKSAVKASSKEKSSGVKTPKKKPEPEPEPEPVAEAPADDGMVEVDIGSDLEIDEPVVPAAGLTAVPAPAAAAEGTMPTMPILQSPMGGRRFKPVKPPLPAGTLEISIARAKYTVRHMTGAIEVERPRKRDPKNPRIYKFTLKGCEVARRHLSGRSVTLADAAELLKAVKVSELEALEGEARRQATKFLLVALSSRNEAELTRDGDLILVRVPFNASDLA